MPDPQPSAAAKRLGRVADMAIHGTPHAIREKRIALALDDAGVGKAVDKLERISLSLACSDLKSWSHLIDEALAALTGEKT